MTRKPVRSTIGEARTIAVVGDVYHLLATGEETNGKYALIEAIVPPGGGPPPHKHSREFTFWKENCGSPSTESRSWRDPVIL